MAHFRHHFSPPPADLLCAEIWSVLNRDYLPKGPFPETDGLLPTPLKFWEIAGDVPRFVGGLSPTLTAARNSPFRNHFSAPSSDLVRPEIWPILILG